MSANTLPKSRSLYEYDSAPPLSQAIPAALQHIMVMFLGSVTVSHLVCTAAGASAGTKALMIQYCTILAGLAILLQILPLRGVGAHVPIIVGVGSTFVPTLTAIAGTYGLSAIFGAQVLCALFTLLLGLSLRHIRRFFPPLVTGTIIMVIGLSLFPIAVKMMAGGNGSPTYGSWKNWTVALVTTLTVVLLNLFARGFVKMVSVLLGAILGYLCAAGMGMIDFSAIGKAGLLSIPVPLQFGMTFEPSVILPILLITIVNVMQTVGDLTGTTAGGMDREPTGEELSGGVIATGLATLAGALIGAPPVSTYSQNVGLVSMTKVVSRRVVLITALFMLAAGFFPKLSAVMATMPSAVVGGNTLVVFGLITLTGLKLIVSEPLTARNCTIVGTALALGMGFSMVPAESFACFPPAAVTLLKTPVVVTGLTVFLFNLIAPKVTAEQEAAARQTLDQN